MGWKEELLSNITSAEGLRNILNLDDKGVESLAKTLETYPMAISQYYLSLINFEDKKDPIRKMCIPSEIENNTDGMKDTSGEASNTKAAGLQHKYSQTALVLSTGQCAMYCRHCFRKRLVGLENSETVNDRQKVFDYISKHSEISNVLLSGGDALLNSNEVINDYLSNLSEIEHLDFIRIGTRIPVVLPSRVYGDEELLKILKKHSQKKQIIIVTQFCHSNEITNESAKAIMALKNIGISVKNQAVLLKGINDEPDVLASLLRGLTKIGVDPYYVFQCRPVEGVKNQFQVPIIKAYKIVEEAKKQLNGVSKGFRYVMSHETGKMEVLGIPKPNHVLFKYHEAKHPEQYGELFDFRVEDDQCWLDI